MPSTCEQRFVDILNDHVLLQLNCLLTCGNYVLDLVISSVADQVIAFEVINPDKAAIFTEHCLFIYFILFWTIFSQGCLVQRGWFEWGPDEKKNNTRNDDR